MQLGYISSNSKGYFIKYCGFLIAGFLIIGMLASCAPTTYFPEEGHWYCAELQMQLDFGDDGDCYVIINGKKMACGCGADSGSKWLSVGCQEVNCDYCDLGEEIFGAIFVSLSETELVVQSKDNGTEYTFLRTE